MNRVYCGPAPDPSDLWASWNLDPVLLACLGVLAFALGRRRGGAWAVAVLVVAFVSPLCALSAALFSARVVHHVLLVAVAAPLIASAWPARRTCQAVPAFVVATAVLWGWHLPVAYDAALGHVGVYWLMQVSLLASAIWMWRAILAPGLSAVEALSLTVAAFAQMGMLGAILTFAPDPLYAAHVIAPYAWGLTPLQDQQLGGVLMWVPAGLPYAVLAVSLARRNWLALKAGLSA
ncbi:cytochrome c oxidase assembly protein [Salipiger sp. IMCC34102]|nr:cytochrome c oxidase assembly protein [Salipiger sp. IMCC34102]